MSATDIRRYTIANEVSVCLPDCANAFQGLEQSEKLYAHYMSQAAWYGGLIVYIQTSPESPGIYVFLLKLFSSQPLEKLQKIGLDAGLTNDEYMAVLVYAAAIFSNAGNYKSFGDTKIIPNLPKEKLATFVDACGLDDDMKKLWSQVVDDIYSLDDRRKELGLSPMGITTYFSSNCDKKDAEFIQDFLTKKDISAYNTRLFKTVSKSGEISYEVRLASVETGGGTIRGLEANILGNHTFTSDDPAMTASVTVTRGDYSPLMAKIVSNLNKAKEYAANEEEKLMLDDYITSFREGSIPAHKDGSRHWIKNKGPVVETYIGFIESYRDPFGVRGEFEGFVAVVNKAMSAKFHELVQNAVELLPLLPWPSIYEKDTFLKPDFTSLDVLSFSGSGVPAGINIPNYVDITQNEGFKNVSLGNVIACAYNDKKVTFLTNEDKVLFSKLKLQSFEVQVGLHELLGHGSGKLFCEDEKGELNFDKDLVLHLVSGEKITTWYKDNETWTSIFSTISSAYEECRAECVGIYLCTSEKVLSIFGHKDNAEDIIYVNWLNMVRAGLMALEYYTPATKSWGQAHMRGRYCILRVLIEAGNDLVKIEKVKGENGQPDLLIHLDRTKIITIGKPAIGQFLVKLQAYKSTADFDGGKAMFDSYSAVDDTQEPKFLSLREIVLARKQPRPMFVQHNTHVKGDDVELLSYEGTSEGLIQSFVDRFSTDDMCDDLLKLWRQDQKHFTY